MEVNQEFLRKLYTPDMWLSNLVSHKCEKQNFIVIIMIKNFNFVYLLHTLCLAHQHCMLLRKKRNV